MTDAPTSATRVRRPVLGGREFTCEVDGRRFRVLVRAAGEEPPPNPRPRVGEFKGSTCVDGDTACQNCDRRGWAGDTCRNCGWIYGSTEAPR